MRAVDLQGSYFTSIVSSIWWSLTMPLDFLLAIESSIPTVTTHDRYKRTVNRPCRVQTFADFTSNPPETTRICPSSLATETRVVRKSKAQSTVIGYYPWIQRISINCHKMIQQFNDLFRIYFNIPLYECHIRYARNSYVLDYKRCL